MNYKLVLGLLAVTIALIQTSEGAWTHTTNTAGFSTCTNENRVCAGDQSGCKAGKCACSVGYTGQPHLACHRQKYKICTIISDPMVSNYAKHPHKGVDVAIPCQLKATHIYVKGTGAAAGTECDAAVYVAEERVGGNFYVSSVKIQLSFMHSSGGQGEVYFQVYGEGNQNFYRYKLRGRDGSNGGYTANGALTAVKHLNFILGGDNQFRLIDTANVVYFKSEFCALEVFFRPSDNSVLRVFDQTQMPGVSIGVNPDIGEITYDTTNPGTCMSPDADKLDVSDVTENLHMSNDEALVFNALSTMAPQDSEEVNSQQCMAAGSSLSYCQSVDSKKEAMNMCSFIFMHKPFVKCFSRAKNSVDLLVLFQKCVKSFCPSGEVYSSCVDLQSSINAKGCFVKAPHVDMALKCDVLAASFGEPAIGPQ